MDSKEILGMLEDSRRALDDVLAKDALEEGRRGVLYELGQNYEALQKELQRTEVVLAAVRAGAAEREAKIGILAEAAAKRTEEANAANARIAELEARLVERTAQLREVQGNWKKYEPFVSRMQEAEAKAASWKEAHERAAVIAGEELNRQRAEFEAQLAEARAISDCTAEANETLLRMCQHYRERANTAETEATQLRAALERVEWHDNSGKGSTKSPFRQCPWCLVFERDGLDYQTHKPDCARQAALRGEGEPL